MKPRLINMLTLTKKLIIDYPATLVLVERNRATMNYRIAIVFRDHLVKIIARFPFQHARLCFVSDHKRRVNTDRVLLKSIDLHGGMIRGGTKLMSLREVRGINVGSRINDERAAARRHFDTQHIVVSMRSTSIDPCATRVEAEIEICVAHDVRAGIGKHARTVVLIRRAHLLKLSHT